MMQEGSQIVLMMMSMKKTQDYQAMMMKMIMIQKESRCLI
jgi:hypothetical protein